MANPLNYRMNQRNEFTIDPGAGMSGAITGLAGLPGMPGSGGEFGFGEELTGGGLLNQGSEGQQMGDIASLKAAEAKMTGGAGGGSAALGGDDFWDILTTVLKTAAMGG